ncbi:MAG: hypothetical protein QGG40_15225, partial [Myxococcota bacterium]|nr:hypothetical protein [Myxococcota bacterium]
MTTESRDAPYDRNRQSAQLAALEALEPFAGVSGTIALHDPLYQWHADGDVAQGVSLEAALAAHPDHPAAPELRRLLGSFLRDLP